MGTIQLHIGDTVQLLASPEIDQRLWDELGIVVGDDRNGRIVVELDDGADCTVLPDQIRFVSRHG